jgi:predicted transcriptional regulator
MPNQALTVRISAGSHRLLRQLAEEENSSMQAILDAAIERYRRERFLRGANADYGALKRDRNAWGKVEDERRVWEGANMDGLDAKE